MEWKSTSGALIVEGSGLSSLRIHVDGHVLDIGQTGDAVYCVLCENATCEKIAIFNKYYRIGIDRSSSKGWHVVQAKEGK